MKMSTRPGTDTREATDRSREQRDDSASVDDTDDIQIEGPALETQDWDAIAGGEIVPESIPDNGDLRYDEGGSPESLEEEDDNPYQESDEALPDDDEEAAIRRGFRKDGGAG
jgi:hypothetical protein